MICVSDFAFCSNGHIVVSVEVSRVQGRWELMLKYCPCSVADKLRLGGKREGKQMQC